MNNIGELFAAKQSADKRWSAPKENKNLADATAMPSGGRI